MTPNTTNRPRVIHPTFAQNLRGANPAHLVMSLLADGRHGHGQRRQVGQEHQRQCSPVHQRKQERREIQWQNRHTERQRPLRIVGERSDLRFPSRRPPHVVHRGQLRHRPCADGDPEMHADRCKQRHLEPRSVAPRHCQPEHRRSTQQTNPGLQQTWPGETHGRPPSTGSAAALPRTGAVGGRQSGPFSSTPATSPAHADGPRGAAWPRPSRARGRTRTPDNARPAAPRRS